MLPLTSYKMVRIALEISAILENVKEITTCGDDFRWFLKLRCNSCGETTDSWQYMSLDERTPTKGGRGYVSMVQKCKMCSRENHIDIMQDQLKSFKSENDGCFVPIAVFDCRGLEPVEFDFRNGWVVLSSCSSKFYEDVDFCEKEWYEYDDQANVSVSVSELQYRFQKTK